MKTLYFDIDGTVLVRDGDAVKSGLAAGAFERAVRKAVFTRLVCVGNFVGTARMIRDILPEYDSIRVIFDVCRGAFVDEVWFRSSTALVADPRNRARHIDFSDDWWYVDDLAQHYMELAGLGMEFMSHQGNRVCAQDPHGNGLDVLEWLNGRVVP